MLLIWLSNKLAFQNRPIFELLDLMQCCSLLLAQDMNSWLYGVMHRLQEQQK